MEFLDEPNQVMAGSNLFIAAIWQVYQKGCRTTKGFIKLIPFVWYPAKVLRRRFEDITAWKQAVKEEATRIPTFYGADIGLSFRVQWFIAFLCSIMFAMVHVVAADFAIFPTYTEQSLWNWSATGIFCVPFILAFLYNSKHARKLPVIAILYIPFMLGIFVLARIAIFVLGFTTLRGLPPEAVNTIHWPKCILIFIGN